MFHAICIRTDRIILFCHRVHGGPAGGQRVVVPCTVVEVRKTGIFQKISRQSQESPGDMNLF